MFACAPAFRGQSLRGFRFAARTEKSRAVMDGDDAMHPPLILFDCRTREFEPARRSFDFIDVTGAERAPQRCRCTEFRYESVMQKRLCA